MLNNDNTTNNPTNAIRRGPEADLRNKQRVYCFNDGSRSFQIMRADLRSNELIEVREIKIERANPLDIINNYIEHLPRTVRNSIVAKMLYFHFTKNDFTKYDIDSQRNEIHRLYPNFIMFWAFEFMHQDIVEFRYSQLELLG
jgi:hypothetical protein